MVVVINFVYSQNKDEYDKIHVWSEAFKKMVPDIFVQDHSIYSRKGQLMTIQRSRKTSLFLDTDNNGMFGQC